MKTLYTARATAHGGRDGHVRSSDDIIDLDVKTPKEMGGAGGRGTNPEQLFAAGYGACFESAMRVVARKRSAPLTDAHVTAAVSFNVADGGKYVLSVELRAHVDGMSVDDAQALMAAAHEVCPYSNATRGNIEVKLVAE
jgi:Ohr subfamily peroxiredoxin